MLHQSNPLGGLVHFLAKSNLLKAKVRYRTVKHLLNNEYVINNTHSIITFIILRLVDSW